MICVAMALYINILLFYCLTDFNVFQKLAEQLNITREAASICFKDMGNDSTKIQEKKHCEQVKK